MKKLATRHDTKQDANNRTSLSFTVDTTLNLYIWFVTSKSTVILGKEQTTRGKDTGRNRKLKLTTSNKGVYRRETTLKIKNKDGMLV